MGIDLSSSPKPANDATEGPHPLTALAAERATDVGESLAQRSFARGLAVTQADGTVRAIPIGAVPVILDDDEVARRATLATHLVSATAKAARWLMAGETRASVLAALGPAEQRLVLATWDGTQALAVARVDFLGEPQLRALEVNTTIPAMQGYSDIAAESWLATFAAGRSDLPALIRANGSNADALRSALVDLYVQSQGSEPASVGLLCRRGDAQLTELRYLAERFREAGLDAWVVHTDELTRARGYLQFDGRPLPLLYRHVFASRFDTAPCAEVEAALATPSRTGTQVFNRPTPHLEMKSTLAWLSGSVDAPALADAIGLDADERRVIAATVPWTRRLLGGEGASKRELLAEVIADPSAFVLKRSWSYGGNEVFVGRGHAGPEFWERVHAIYPGVRTWSALCERAAQDPRGGGFVVQRAVPRAQTHQVLCTPGRAQTARVTTDYAAYATLGGSAKWSGVCRAATSDVVNIVGGGAVVPVIRREVADRLMKTGNQ